MTRVNENTFEEVILPPPPPPAYPDAPKQETVHTQNQVPNRILQALKDCANVATLLRISGMAAVLAAMSAFILQDWGMGDDINRYYILLAQTFLLAFGGLGLSYLLKENKGARSFFGLSVISITANMATLGALVFSVTQWGSNLTQYPDFARWVATDPTQLTLALAAGGVASVIILSLGHMILARRSAKVLAGLGLFTNLLLLLPIRESFLLGVLLIAAVLVPMALLYRQMQKDPTLRTPSGYFAMATVMIPGAIILVRSLWLYDMDAMMEAIIATLAFATLHFITRLMEKGFFRGLCDLLSLYAAGHVAVAVVEMLHRPLPDELAISIAALTFGALATQIATRDEELKRGYFRFGAFAVLAAQLALVIFEGGLGVSFLAVTSGGLILLTTTFVSDRWVSAFGALCIFAGVAEQVHRIIVYIDFSNWITLSILGVSAIVLGSVIERHGAIIKLKLQRLMQHSRV